MELSVFPSPTGPFSLPSSASSTSSSESRSHRHRHEHANRRATCTRTTDSNVGVDARDDVYHPHRQEQQRNLVQQHQRRHHTSSSFSDKSMGSFSSRKESDELSLASTCDDRPRRKVPLDKEMISSDISTQNEQEKEQEQMRDQVICMIFDLPETTQFYQDFSCAVASTLAMHGRMYPTSSHVCFYSNVFGRERKILIPYESICEIKKTTTMMFQHAIRLTTFDKDEYTFTSFWGNNRDSCCDLILKTRDRVLAKSRPTSGKLSDSRFTAPQTSRVVNDTQLPTSSSSPSQGSSVAAGQSEEEEEREVDVEASCGQDDTAECSNGDAIRADKDNDTYGQTNPTIPRRHRVVSDVDSIAPKDISMTQIYKEVFPLSADTFMQLFLLDNAPFGLDKFNEQMGSTEMTVSPWVTPSEDDKSFGLTRSLQFRTPIEAPIGPKSSKVDVLQCMKENAQGVRVVESSTRLVDIPYGDYFSVEDRWTIVPQPSNPDACKIYIELKVVFGKSTFWQNTIESRAIKENRTKWEKWISMAKEFLDSRNVKGEGCTVESPLLSSSDNEVVQDAPRKGLRSTKHRGKLRHRHQYSIDAVMPSEGARVAHVKVFPWVLVLLLVLVILRLQMTLSSIERSLLVNTQRIGDLQNHIKSLQTRSGLAT